MIRLTQTSDPKSIPEMVEHFVFRDNRMSAQFVQQLVEYLTTRPEKLLIVQARSDEGLLGFVIAETCPDDSVWIAQMWSDPDNSWSVADNMFGRVVLWAVSLGKNNIRAESSRSIDALLRRFGFTEIAKIVEHNIPPTVLPRAVQSLKELPSG